MKCLFGMRMFLLAGCVGCGHALAACDTPTLVSPTQTEISEALPRFEWMSVQGVRSYLVWLESRVPEGRVLFSEEIQTTASFLMPSRPLANGKASVRIRVTAICKDDTLAVQSARYRIDEDRACRIKTAPVVELDRGQWSVHWEATPSAQRYEIRVHAAEDGKLVFTRSSIGTAAKFDPRGPGSWLFAVQPECKGVKGITSWVATRVH